MHLSANYNKLAWAIKAKYGITLKWAMKTAYCIRDLGLEEPELVLSLPESSLAAIWDPANVMKMISLIRSQARLSSCSERSEELDAIADTLYDRYSALEGIGCRFISQFLEGELVYWATKYYVTSLEAKKRDPKIRSYSIDPQGDGESSAVPTWLGVYYSGYGI